MSQFTLTLQGDKFLYLHIYNAVCYVNVWLTDDFMKMYHSIDVSISSLLAQEFEDKADTSSEEEKELDQPDQQQYKEENTQPFKQG